MAVVKGYKVNTFTGLFREVWILTWKNLAIEVRHHAISTVFKAVYPACGIHRLLGICWDSFYYPFNLWDRQFQSSAIVDGRNQ
jgi:hypothetical protein